LPGIVETLRRALGPRPQPGRAIALVDLHQHTRGGHFGTWLRWFAGQFSTRFDDVHVVTPDPRLTETLFRDGALGNVTFHPLPRALRKRFDADALRGIRGVRREHLCAFLMWGYDLLDRPPVRPDSAVPWATLVGLSWSTRGHDNKTAGMERRLVELLQGSPSCRAFLQPDGYLTRVPGKAVPLPDLEDVSRPPRPTALAERIRAHAGGRLCLGAFGLLTGFRVLDELLPLAKAQPDVRFVMAGKIDADSVAPELRPLLAEGALPNLLAVPGFIATEEELNEAIAATDAVFIDGARYPVHSAIACKAVEFGVGVVTPRSNSWTEDFIRDRGVGIVYDSRTDDLAGAWGRWKADGGEARCRAASAWMRDDAGMAACFDRVAGALTSGFERSAA
jgi:hypothetical protein